MLVKLLSSSLHRLPISSMLTKQQAPHSAAQETDKSPSTLALLCQHFYPEMLSTGLYMTELSAALTQHGYNLRVYCTRPTYLPEDEDDSSAEELHHRDTYRGVQIIRLPTLGNPRGAMPSRGLFALSFLLTTIIFLFHHRRQIHGIITTTNPPFIGLAAVIGRRLLRLPFVTIVHDVYPDIAIYLGAVSANGIMARLWRRFTQSIFYHSEKLVVIGRDMAEIVSSKLPPAQHDKIALIPNWSNEQHVYPVPAHENTFAQEHNPQDTFIIQYAGRMGRTHNLEPLLEAAELLCDEPVLFQFVGDGAKRQSLQAQVRTKKLTNVQFLPYQPFERLHEMLSAPHIAVVCLDERFTGLSVPSKTYGVMAAGRPLLAFLDPNSEIGRVIQENECGIVLPSADGAAIAETIRCLMADRTQLRHMGYNARQAFLANYTLTHAAGRYQQLLHETFYCYNKE